MSDLVRQQAKSAERLVKNSLWLFFAEALSKLIALATQIVAARYLGKEGYGVFSFAFALAGAFIVFTDAGIGVYITRELTRRPERPGELLGRVFVLKGWVSLATLVALAGFTLAAGIAGDARWVVAAAGLALLLNGYTDAVLAALRALESMARVARLMVMQRLVFFLLAAAVLLMGLGTVAFALAFLASSVLAFLLSRRTLADLAGGTPLAGGQEGLEEIFRAVLPLCGVFLCAYVYYRIDAVLLYFLRGEAETGWYAAAFKLTETLVLLAASIRAAVFPRLAKSFREERGDRNPRAWVEAGRYLTILGVPVAAGILVLAPRISAGLFGPDYAPAAAALGLMVLALPLLFLNDLALYLLLSRERTPQALRAALCAALFNPAANLLVIPRFGMEGAAAVAVLTQVLLFLMLSRALVREGMSSPLVRWFWRPLAAASGMAGVMLWMDAGPLVMQIFLGAGAYLLLLGAMHGLSEYDLLILRGLFNRARPAAAGPPMEEVPFPSCDVSIITVNHDSSEYLRDCLKSLFLGERPVTCEVIVVDNGSSDGCAEMVRGEFPAVRLIANQDNLGFARACNQGMRAARGRYLLLLNNDTRVPAGTLETLVATMDRSRDIGLLGCRLVGDDGRVQQSFGRTVGFAYEFARKFILNPLFKRSHLSWVRKMIDGAHDTELEVDWVRGACMFLRREALMEAGLMDENFFLYFEDGDLGVRIRRLGWRVVYTPAATIIHHGQASTHKSRRRSALEYRRSQMYYYKKHYGPLALAFLRSYLYLKMQKNRLRARVGAGAAGRGKEGEASDRLNEEILQAVRTFR